MDDKELLEAIKARVKDDALIGALKEKFDEKNKAINDIEGAFRNLRITNEKLIESERTRSNFLSELRNEINNPTAAIIALTEGVIYSNETEVTAYKEMARILFKEAISLDFHMNNILLAAELEAGEIDLEMSRVNVTSIVKERLDRFAPLMVDKKVTARAELEKPLWINTDKELLTAVASNLISNAVVFNSEGGLLDVTAEVEGDSLIFSVRDGGAGISEADQKKIFDRFIQLDSGLAKKYRGLGLGLSVTKAAAEMLGGTITIKSEPGKGSIFTLMMPAKLSEDVENVAVDGAEFFF